jgi:hypothetical protein
MEGLSGRKLSELLSVMDKLKPKDPNSFYAYHFLQWMPREVRLLLARKDLSDMRALAAEADDLMALHQPQARDAVAAIQPAEQAAEATGESDSVAAISRTSGQNKIEEEGRKKAAQPQLIAVHSREVAAVLGAHQVWLQGLLLRQTLRLAGK